MSLAKDDEGAVYYVRNSCWDVDVDTLEPIPAKGSQENRQESDPSSPDAAVGEADDVVAFVPASPTEALATIGRSRSIPARLSQAFQIELSRELFTYLDLNADLKETSGLYFVL